MQNTSATCFPPAHGHYWPVVTLAQDRNIQTGLAGSFVIHALALLLLLWGFSTEAGKHLLPPPVVKEEPVQEVTMIFPEQLIPAPLLPKEPPPKAYIRTTQNEGVAAAPKNAVFQSDRNTVAASKLPPKSDATLMMPTLNGNAPTTLELANRDYRDGQIKNDNAPLANATPLEMRQPQPPAPPSVLKPADVRDVRAIILLEAISQERRECGAVPLPMALTPITPMARASRSPRPVRRRLASKANG